METSECNQDDINSNDEKRKRGQFLDKNISWGLTVPSWVDELGKLGTLHSRLGIMQDHDLRSKLGSIVQTSNILSGINQTLSATSRISSLAREIALTRERLGLPLLTTVQSMAPITTALYATPTPFHPAYLKGINDYSIGASLQSILDSDIYKITIEANQLMQETRWVSLSNALTGSCVAKGMLNIQLGQVINTYDKLIPSWYGNPQTQSLYSDLFKTPAQEYYNTSQVLEVLSTDEEIEDREFQDEVDIETGLSKLNPAFAKAWHGLLLVKDSDNPDKTRHFSASARELIIALLKNVAPHNNVKPWLAQSGLQPSGHGISHRDQLRYISRNVNNEDFGKFVEQDITANLSLLQLTNGGLHEIGREYTSMQLNVMTIKLYSMIRTILILHSAM